LVLFAGVHCGKSDNTRITPSARRVYKKTVGLLAIHLILEVSIPRYCIDFGMTGKQFNIGFEKQNKFVIVFKFDGSSVIKLSLQYNSLIVFGSGGIVVILLVSMFKYANLLVMLDMIERFVILLFEQINLVKEFDKVDKLVN
jgi:hypothetical protein